MTLRRDGGPATARWSDAIQRAGIIRTYLSIEKPTVADADAAATSLGVKRRNFYHLVEAFKRNAHGSPPKKLPSDVEHVIDETLSKLDTNTTMADILRIVRQLAKDNGHRVPANATIKRRVAERAMSAASPNLLIVDHAQLIAVVDEGYGRIAPHVVVAVAPGAGVVGLTVTTKPPTDLDRAMVAMEGMEMIQPSSAMVEFVGSRPAEHGAVSLKQPVSVSDRFKKAGSAINLLLNNRVGGIPVAHRLSSEALIARTAHLPVATYTDIEMHLRHVLRLSLFLPEIRTLQRGDVDVG